MPVAAESCGRLRPNVRSLRPNRAVVAFALTSQCEDIVQSMHHIPISCTNIFDLLYQYKIMRPIQMLDGEGEIIFVEKLHHILHITYSKSFYFGIIILQIRCQPLQGFLTPTVCFLTLLQQASNIPIHPEQLCHGPLDRKSVV